MSKILFIEGVSGVGKSTSTIKIADMLRQNGFLVKHFIESDYKNPIDFYCTAYFNKN
ncbi:MAG: hypothetical protein R3Y35_12575 [Clostridia bacterium]